MPIKSNCTNSLTSSLNVTGEIQSSTLRFAFADGLRGIAALWVVMFHLSKGHHIDKLKDYFPNIFRVVLLDSGSLGVAIFFVLSGYVMTHTIYRYQVDLSFATNFTLRRLTRLSPPYYFAILIALIFLMLKSKVTGADVNFPSLSGFLIHLIYAQDFFKVPQINSVFWTLGIEVQFYLAFAMMMFFSDWLAKRFILENARFYIISIMAILSLLWIFGFVSSPIWQGGFIGFWYSFMVGVTVSYAVSSNEKSYITLASLNIILVAIAGVITRDAFILMVVFTAAILLYAGLYGKMSTWLNWRWLQSLGLISYSLYLLHGPVTGATANLIRHFFSESITTDLIVLMTTSMASLIAGWLAFQFVEKPSISWSHLIARRIK
jgi:peptidoglycan/LPS O-acetylase OafA/YrhL